MKTAITGATGLIGNSLCRRLLERGDEVVGLSRHPERAREELPEGATAAAFEVGAPDVVARSIAGCDAVVNLAGEPVVGQRWTAAARHRILRSRTEGTRTVVDAVAGMKERPGVLVNGSAVGYYGVRRDDPADEDGPAGAGFLAEVCVEWEKEAVKAEALGLRVVRLRTGMVLAADGGALPPMSTAFKAFLGGPVGNGRQPISWIHVDDLVGVVLHALDSPGVSGPLNGTAPEPETNRTFSKKLAKALHRPCYLRMPKWFLHLALGRAASMITGGQRALPRRVLESGYEFRYPRLEGALEDLVATMKKKQ